MVRLCKIAISGKLIEGFHIETVRANLIKNFKVTEQQANRFLNGKPLIVKDNLEYQSAEKYRDAFEKAGLVCRIEQTDDQSDLNRAVDSAEHSASRQQEALYKVVFMGTIEPGHSIQDVKQNLAQIYKIDIQKIERLFTGKPVTLKDRIDRQSAVRLQAALQKTGAVCTIQPLVAEKAAKPVQHVAKEPAFQQPAYSYTLSAEKILHDEAEALPKCPKCGYQATSHSDPLRTGMGGFDECPACGIIVAKYVKRMSQTQASAVQTPAPGTPAEQSTAAGIKPLTGNPPAKPNVLAPEGTTTGIEVTPHFFPLAFFLYFCYAHVEINGEVHKIDSGKASFFPLYPGSYTLRLFVPYPSKPELGLITKQITVGEKAATRYDFHVFPWSSNPGTLTINGVKSAATPKAAKHDANTPASFEVLKQLSETIAESIFQPELLKRLGAAIIDSIILGLCIGLMLYGLSFAMGLSMNALLSKLYVHIGAQAVLWLYFALLESSAWQATVGKKLLSLTVIDNEGNCISFFRATFRHLARLIILPCTLFIGFLMIAYSDQKQGLHDRASGTQVVSG